MPEPTPEVAEALLELRQYLSDQLAPLMVCNSLEMLQSQPPELVAREVHGWLASQYSGPNASVPISDYLFHALKKLHSVGELKLVPLPELQQYIDRLAPLLEAMCPDGDRELLRANVKRLDTAAAALDAPVPTIYRQTGSAAPLASTAATAGAPVAPLAALGDSFRIVERLLAALEVSGAPRKQEMAPEVIAAATVRSRDSAELDALLRRLRKAGIDVTGKQLFRALSRKLPDWTPPVPAGPEPAKGEESAIVGAMGRVITLAPDKNEALARFRQMVETAVEQVNEGALARAATMLELAEKLLERETLDKGAAAVFRERAHAGMDLERLRAATERTDKRPQLRRVLAFFPRLRPKALLEALRAETRRDRRRLWIALLEAHGTPARDEALHALEATIASPAADWYFQRNLLYLVRRIPRGDEWSLAAEIGLFELLSAGDRPVPLVKEAIANLGHVPDARAEAVLLSRFREVEARAVRTPLADPGREEAMSLLDRIAAALARIGTSAAATFLVEHALRQGPLGEAPAAWLDHLSGRDLAAAPDATAALLKALRAEFPTGLLRLRRHAASERLAHVVSSLSGTRTPAVLEAIEEVARRYQDGEAARRARQVLEAPPAPAAPSGLTGDLELFGLPVLLQTFAQTEATGWLVVRNGAGEPIGTLFLESGRLRGARVGTLLGPEAVYQLLQRPVAGSFSFGSPGPSPADVPLHEPRDVVAILLEGMRRFDELQRASALVPDDVPLRPTRVKPTPDGQECDPLVLRSVWARAAAGGTAAQCESAVKIDSYRVRRMLVHWVEEGSLQPAEAAAS